MRSTSRLLQYSLLAILWGACHYLPDPPKRICGDGKLQELEDCDDGNVDNDDGCRNDCTANVAPACGDGLLSAGEECDGANLNQQSCTSVGFESGELSCDATCHLNTVLCAPVGCGNAELDPNETCDDGNTDNNDGCSATCRLEACGDSVVQANEQCDDGNTNSGDGCSVGCTAEICGNGVQDAGETCDDGNDDNDDGCSAACQSERCGDGVVQANEECDDANNNNTDACTNSCQSATCGDSIVQANEQCDDGNQTDTDACRNSCQLPVCGDGVVSSGEQCEPPNTAGCSAQCTLQCQNDSDCADSDPCTQNERCSVGVCVRDPKPVDDNNACTLDFCDPTNGNAIHTPISAINDNNGCTTDSCNPANGAVTHTPVNVDDNNGCTTDACNPANGAVTHTSNVGQSCSDGSACTVSDTCNAAAACVGSPVNVDDGNACTADACNPANGAISHNANVGASCSDNNGCTVSDTCNAAAACVGSPVNVDDNNGCTTDSCNPANGAVTHTSNVGQSCSDGNACTSSDACNASGGCAGAPVNVDDGNACTADACNPANGAISHNANVGASCDDGDSCTASDACNASGSCVGAPINTDDGNPCTNDACSSGQITHTPNSNTCNDGNACTINDTCSNGSCGGSTRDCNDNDACTFDSCDPAGGCLHGFLSCDDGDPCTFEFCDSNFGCQVEFDNCCGDPCCVPFAATPPGSPQPMIEPICPFVLEEDPCTLAIPIAPGDRVVGSSSKANDVFSASLCGGAASAKDNFYQIHITKELNARFYINGNNDFSPVLALLPAAASCDTSAAPVACGDSLLVDRGLRKASMTATVTPGDYILVVEGAADAEGSFEFWWEELPSYQVPTSELPLRALAKELPSYAPSKTLQTLLRVLWGPLTVWL